MRISDWSSDVCSSDLRDDIGATVTGPLRFVSDGSGGTISGDVAVNESRYRLGRETAATAVPQLNIREINLPGGGEEDEEPTRTWQLDVHAKMTKRQTVTGLGPTGRAWCRERAWKYR